MTGDDKRMTFVMFSTADWAAPYWTNKQHIADRLAKRGHQVLYIESPGIRSPRANTRDLLRIWNRLKRAFIPPKKVDQTLWVYAPLTIPFGHKSRLVRAFNRWLLGSAIHKWLKRNRDGDDVIVWTYHPYIDGIMDGLPVRSTIYHCVDDLAAIPGVDADSFRKAEVTLLERADRVFTTSPYLQSHCAAVAGERSVYERNVADIEHFSQARHAGTIPAELAEISGPKLCYTGVLSDYKLDFSLIEQCAVARPGWNWIFIGDEPEGQKSPAVSRLREMPNVYFFGYRSYDTLPSYLRGTDIAVLPNLTTGYMSGVFPMKLYEYMAAGKPIISTGIDALDDIKDQIAVAHDPTEWIYSVEKLLTAPPEAIGLHDPRLLNFSWEARLDRMLAWI